MKKTISINLQGIIFHVEEDGYALLHSYLTSVKAYFSTFEGHEEIMADIESRMAEIFLTRQNPGKQIVTLEDVQYLVGRMGSVQDFAQIDADDSEPAYAQQQKQTYANTGSTAEPGSRRLYRDESRKMVAGVAAGIANYLSVDPLWVRLFFVLTVIGLPFTAGGSGLGVVLYIILWIVLPINFSLPERKVKKLYRDPDDKKLSGVSAGIGAYFGIDPTWIRLFFLVSVFFFGTGILAYIILWIVMPEAKTPSEKAEMRGNPVTLSSIEQAVRNNQAFKDERGQENFLAKIILLPVQLLSQVIEALGPALKAILLFLFALIRIVAGILLVMLGLTGIAAAIVLLISGFGFVDPESNMVLADIPVQLFAGDFSWYGIIALFLATVIPAIVVLITGLSLFAKRWLLRAPVGWTLFGLWLISVVVASVSGALYANNFKRTAMFTEQVKYTLPASGTILLSGKTYEGDGNLTQYDDLDLTIEAGPDSTSLVLLKQYSGKGRNEQEATQAARMLEIPVTQTDSGLTISTSQLFKKGTRFRGQDLSLRLLVPENKPFTVSETLAGNVDFSPSPEQFFASDLIGKTVQFRNGKLECLNCTAADSANETRHHSADIPADASSRSFDYEHFQHINASGAMKVNIVQGNRYRVRAYGKPAQLRDLEFDYVDGNELKISLDRNIWNNRKHEPVVVEIEMPELKTIAFAGAVEGTVQNFRGERIEVTLVGASTADMDLQCTRLEANLIGASNLKVSGTADDLSAEVVGASELDAGGLRVRRANLEAVGASSAKVMVTDRLTAEASGASHIRYAGNPREVEQDESGAGSVRPE